MSAPALGISNIGISQVWPEEMKKNKKSGETRFMSDPGKAAANGDKREEGAYGQALQPDQHNLRQAWEASHRSTKDDWVEWMRRFSLELLRESASPALRACWSLAQVYQPLS